MKRDLIILIPHYNNKEALINSIKSIKEDFCIDLVIVDDGSKNSIPNLQELKQIYTQGEIFLEILPNNKGIEYALNNGLEFILNKNYKYIGRLDCGDFCKRDKFKKQLDYLERNEDIYLLGTWVDVLNQDKKFIYELKHPLNHEEIKKKMFFNSMFVHPSVVFRSEVVRNVGKYPTIYKAAEDYAFFFKIIKKYKAENLPESLLEYIIDDFSISTTKRKTQVKSRIKIIIANFYLGYYPIVGLCRNTLLFFIGRNTSNNIKRILNYVK